MFIGLGHNCLHVCDGIKLLFVFNKLPACDDELFNCDPCDGKQVTMNPAFSAFQIFPSISLKF